MFLQWIQNLKFIIANKILELCLQLFEVPKQKGKKKWERYTRKVSVRYEHFFQAFFTLQVISSQPTNL